MDFRQKFPYMLLGIGIGILVTNIVYNFYPNIEYREYTQEEIIQQAKELGMVFFKDTIEINNPIEDEEIQQEETEKVQFIIQQGDYLEKIAKNLYDKGIIDDMDNFIKYVKDKGVDKKFRVGTYKLSPNLSYDEIIDVLLKKK